MVALKWAGDKIVFSFFPVRIIELKTVYFLQLPIDYKNLSTEEQLKVLANRRPKEQKKEIKDNLDGDTFSAENYLNRFKSW